MKKITKYFAGAILFLFLLLCGAELTLRSDTGIRYLLKIAMYFRSPKSCIEIEKGRGSLIKGCLLEGLRVRNEDGEFFAKRFDFTVLGLSKCEVSITDAKYEEAISDRGRLLSRFKDLRISVDNGNKTIEVNNGDLALTSDSKFQFSGIKSVLTKNVSSPAFNFEMEGKGINYDNFSATSLKASGMLSTDGEPTCQANITAVDSIFEKIPLGQIKSDLIVTKTGEEFSYKAEGLFIAGCLFKVEGIFRKGRISGEVHLRSLSEQIFKVLLEKVNLQWALPILKIFKGSSIEFDNHKNRLRFKFKPSTAIGYVPEINIETSNDTTILSSKRQKNCFLINGKFFYKSDSKLIGHFLLQGPENLPNLPSATCDFKCDRRDFLLTLTTDDNVELSIIGTRDKDSIKASLFKIKSKEFAIHNKTPLTLVNGLISGEITGNLKNIEKLAEIAGLNNVAGQASFNLVGRKSSFNAIINVNKLSTDLFSMHNARVKIENWRNLLPNSASMTAKYGKMGGVSYKDLSVKTYSTNPSDLIYEISCLVGRSGNAVLFTLGKFSISDQGTRTTVDKFLLTNKENSLRLKSKACFTLSQDRINILIPEIIANDKGSASFALDKHTSRINAYVDIKNFPVSALKVIGFDLYNVGAVSSEIVCKGEIKSPIISWNVAVTDLAKKGKNLKMRFLCKGNYNKGKLSSFIEFPKLIGIHGKCKVDLGCNLMLFPYRFFLNDTAPIYIECDLRSNLSKSMGEILPDEMACWGRLESCFKISGSAQAPNVSGYLTLENGGFEKVSSGTYINSLNLHIKSDKANVLLCRASATDANRGKVTVQGAASLVKQGKAQTLLADANVKFQNFKIIDEDDLIVSVDGDSFLKGPLNNLMFLGSLEMPYVLVDIDTTYNDNRGGIQILECGRYIDVLAQKKIQVNLPFKCDVHLNCKKLKLKGKMLDSSWKGNVRLVGGKDKEGALDGMLTLEKGEFLFLGKTIPIINGIITYSEKAPFVPMVNMYASKDIGLAKVTANIKQGSGEISFLLSSEPFMPLEAIFSYLLFGKSQYDLTLIEALQVNGVVATIKSQSNKTFSALQGLDQSNHDQDLAQHNNVNIGNVGFGQHIGNNVYVSVESDTIHKVAYLNVQILLSPKLSGKVNSLGEVGMDWRRRY
ncbi:MAG: translocation/assembly module TamB domain-containing protein [Holosporales bacterium]|jgi:hypothetical protein|nr:translocation/assembly module TamB domain-containing protein [Holosporales bacterium]